jgi:GNAT superfamily N-acetyltransferase
MALRRGLIMEPVIRVGVVVTFMRMDHPPADAAPALPPNCEMRLLSPCSVAEYRYLYDTVGAPYVWWLRRTMPDGELASLLASPSVSIHVLYRNGEPAGFFELDRTMMPNVNLSYFGLMPHAVGGHIGYAFLRRAVDTAWGFGARSMSVNTCTADHPRALPTYLRAGFRIMRQVPETWHVPTRLGLAIPPGLVV